MSLISHPILLKKERQTGKMSSKAIIFLCLTALVLLMISSEVSARELSEAETESTVSSTSSHDLDGFGFGRKGHGKGYGKGYKRHCKCCGRYFCKCCTAAYQAEVAAAQSVHDEAKPQN